VVVTDLAGATPTSDIVDTTRLAGAATTSDSITTATGLPRDAANLASGAPTLDVVDATLHRHAVCLLRCCHWL
jgi:hypothetical protein